MLIDAKEVAAGGRLHADVVVIGSGPAGLALVRRLAASGTSVVVLESGGLKRERSVEELNAGASTDPSIHATPNLFRARTIGGASSIWGGRCVPLDPIDFERREWVPGSGWPISYDDVARWHAPSMEFLEAGDAAFGEDSLEDPEPWIEGLQKGALPISVERFSPPTHVGRRYREELVRAPTVKLVTHATCLALSASENGAAVDALRCCGPDGAQFEVRARWVVLAAGGLENARLLLASRDRDARGLGNQHDRVGRHYMCHIEGTFGELCLTPSERSVRWGFERTSDGIYARRRLAMPAEIQARLRLRNGIARLHYPFAADPAHRDPVLSLMFLTKSFLIPEFTRKVAMIDRARQAELTDRRKLLAGHLSNVIRSSPSLVPFVFDWVRRRHLSYRRIPYVALPSRSGRYPLDFNGEQEPNPESRVTLAAQSDRLGVPQLSIDWRMTEGDASSVVATYDYWRSQLEASGVGSLAYDRDELFAAVKSGVPVGGHHIGTTRMSAAPRDGVVDADCRVHGIDNLFVAGASVFPTCGHANPTLTIVALALRLAHHLEQRLSETRLMRTAS